MVNDSNNQLFAKAAAALLRMGVLNSQAEWQKGNFWVCDGENSDLHKNCQGVRIHHGQKTTTIWDLKQIRKKKQ